MEKCFIHSQIWDEIMECDILRKREGEKNKIKPIQIWFSWIGNVVVSPIHTQIELLGWMEKGFFIHPQMWDERMESHIYITYSKGRMKPPLNPCVPSSVPSSILYPSVRSSMRIDTLEAPRLPAAHHPSAESDTVAFCPPRMGRK